MQAPLDKASAPAAAHGGMLRELLLDPATAAEVKARSRSFPSHTLTARQACDLELLLGGALTPLGGFMTHTEYHGVLDRMRLSNGALWPIPITLDIPEALAHTLQPGQELALRDAEGFMPAVLVVEDIWQPDLGHEARHVYGTDAPHHPGVRRLLHTTHPWYAGGRILGLEPPVHYDFEALRHTPATLHQIFRAQGWQRVLAFHTGKPMHRIHRELTVQAAEKVGAAILLHPVIGITKPGDLHYYARVRCYQAILRHFPAHQTLLALAPLAVRMAGPREALLNAIIRQNYGCTHFIVGPEHAAPPDVRDGGTRFYPTYAAQELVAQHQHELGIQMIPIPELAHDARRGRFVAVAGEQPSTSLQCFSETGLRQQLSLGKTPEPWVSYPEVLAELARVYPPRCRQGLTLFFTGLSGSGKSTLARIVYGKFIETGERPASLLDGDIVRQHLSSELGFSKIHRDLNVRRIGYVASEITKNRGVAICAPIAPYAETRRAVREMIEQHGAFVEIHVATPLDICEQRDRKGLYAKARQGLIPEFTGVSDPYETPQYPEISIDTTHLSPGQAAHAVWAYLAREGFIEPDGATAPDLPQGNTTFGL